MMDNRPAAAQLIELARKHLDEFTLWGAVFYVYNSAQERKLPWATPEALKVAEDAFDQAVRSWLGDRLDALSRFRTGRALLEEAAREGRDPLRDALMYLNQSTQ